MCLFLQQWYDAHTCSIRATYAEQSGDGRGNAGSLYALIKMLRLESSAVDEQR